MTRALIDARDVPTAPKRAGGARAGVRLDTGLLVALASAAAFGTSGPFSKALLESGWSAGSIVLLRVTGAALLLLGPALLAVRGRWHAGAGQPGHDRGLRAGRGGRLPGGLRQRHRVPARSGWRCCWSTWPWCWSRSGPGSAPGRARAG